MRPHFCPQQVAFCQLLQGCPITARLHGVYEDSTHVYIAQELCSGGDIDSLQAAAGGRLDEREAAAVVLSVLRFLAHAHAAGVCYGDVKPGNFVLRRLVSAGGAGIPYARLPQRPPPLRTGRPGGLGAPAQWSHPLNPHPPTHPRTLPKSSPVPVHRPHDRPLRAKGPAGRVRRRLRLLPARRAGRLPA